MNKILLKSLATLATIIVLLVVAFAGLWAFTGNTMAYAFMRSDMLLKTRRHTLTLPAVTNPEAYTKEFDPKRQSPVELEVKSQGFTGRVVRSSLFPHADLETRQITNMVDSKSIYGTCQERYFNRDPYWKVFWVEVATCGERTKFYGPYRVA